jgi:hypothetical protein
MLYQCPSQQKLVNFLRKLQCFSGHVFAGHFWRPKQFFHLLKNRENRVYQGTLLFVAQIKELGESFLTV